MEPTLPLPRLKSTALHTLVIHLGVVDDGALPGACGRAIHAQVLDWFRLADPAISEAIHKSQESPLSLSGLMGKRRKAGVRAGDEFYFRIGFVVFYLILDPMFCAFGSKNPNLTNTPQMC